MKAKSNGIEINYTVQGEGPWVVMSHSLGCDVSMWDEQVRALKSNFKVMCFDTRGHGASDAPFRGLGAPGLQLAQFGFFRSRGRGGRRRCAQGEHEERHAHRDKKGPENEEGGGAVHGLEAATAADEATAGAELAEEAGL